MSFILIIPEVLGENGVMWQEDCRENKVLDNLKDEKTGSDQINGIPKEVEHNLHVLKAIVDVTHPFCWKIPSSNRRVSQQKSVFSSHFLGPGTVVQPVSDQAIKDHSFGCNNRINVLLAVYVYKSGLAVPESFQVQSTLFARECQGKRQYGQ